MPPAPDPKPGLGTETKVGLLFFAGLGLALWFTFFTTDIGQAQSQYSVTFTSISQLKQGDAVTFNGVRVGTVTEVVPVRDGDHARVRVGFIIDKQYRDAVLVDSQTIYRVVLGTLGGANLDIHSMGGEPIDAMKLGGITGQDGVSLSDAVAAIKALVEENRVAITAAIAAFGEASTEIRDLVKENRETVSRALTNVDRMSAQIADLVTENRETVKAAMVNFKEMTAQIEALVHENRDNMRLAIEALPAAVQNFREAAARVEELIAANQADVRTLMESLAALAPKLDRIGTNIEQITTQIADGKGSLGKLVMDDELHDGAVGAVENLDRRLEEVKPFTASLSTLRLAATIYGGMNTETGVATGHAGIRLEPRPWKFFDVGISYRSAPDDRDALPEEDDIAINLDLMLGWRFFPDDDEQIYRLTVAGGMMESQPAAYVQLPIWGDRLTLTGFIRPKDNDKPKLDREYEDGQVMLRTTLEWKPIRHVGIWVVGGVDDLAEEPAPWVGLRGVLYDDDFRNLIGVASFGR